MWMLTVICTTADQPVTHLTQTWRYSNSPTTVRHFSLRSFLFFSVTCETTHSKTKENTTDSLLCTLVTPFQSFMSLSLSVLLFFIYENLCITYRIWQRHDRLKLDSVISLWLQILTIICHQRRGLTLDARHPTKLPYHSPLQGDRGRENSVKGS